MNQQLHYTFGPELVAQRRAEFELAARHHSLLRRLKELRRAARREDPVVHRPRRSPGAGAGRPAPARCAGDVG